MYLIIANPKAGNQAYRKLKSPIHRLLDHQGVRYRIEEVADLNDIESVIANYKEKHLLGIVALGGNATVNATLNAIPKMNVPFGIIPISKSNTLAAEIGITDWRTGVRALTPEPATKVHTLGQIGERYFIGRAKVLPKKNLMAYRVARTTWFDQVIKLLDITRRLHWTAVLTHIVADDSLRLTGSLRETDIRIDEEVTSKKKLRIETAASLDDTSSPSLTRFYAREAEITGEVNLIVLVGNEVIANTPVTIKSMQRTIPLIVPAKKQLRLPDNFGSF